MNQIIFPAEVLQRLKSHAIQKYPYECCGVLLGKNLQEEKVVLQIVESENSSLKSKKRTFSISPLELFQIEKVAEKKKLEVLGFYHSHPEGEAILSKEDREHMIPSVLYPVISIKRKISGENQIEIRAYKKNAFNKIDEDKFICR